MGKFGSVPGGSHGRWTGRHRTGTSEPVLARTSSCGQGQIISKVPMS